MSDSDRSGGGNSDGTNTGVVVRTRPKTRKPAMYKVLMLNDDYTPMEFVVWILKSLFYKTHDEAMHLMLQVHHEGRGVAGVFTHDVARTKLMQVEEVSRKHQHPLACRLEACEG